VDVDTGEQKPQTDSNFAIFRQKEGFSGLDLQLTLGRRARELDVRARRVTLDDGGVLDYDGLVIATGARARRLSLGAGLSGIHVLRTLDDSLAIRAAFAARPRVLVVGAGLIGLEVAAACHKLDLSVVVIETEAAPLARSLGTCRRRARRCTARAAWICACHGADRAGGPRGWSAPGSATAAHSRSIWSSRDRRAARIEWLAGSGSRSATV
jgi:NADPH-dependent 2,4-dienoyl-CoA reductase/sulfur reductase-like enzyme